MSSTLAVAFTSNLTVVETLTGQYVAPGDNTVTTNGLNESATYTGSTSPAVSKHAAFQQALTAGTATIDLTLLPGEVPNQTVDFTGLKVQFLKFRNLSTNANVLTVAQGGSNPYRLDATTATWSITLAPGQSVLLWLDGAADTVGGTHKTIALTGTSSQVLEVQAVAG